MFPIVSDDKNGQKHTVEVVQGIVSDYAHYAEEGTH